MRAKYPFHGKNYLLLFILIFGLISCRNSEKPSQSIDESTKADSSSVLNSGIEYLLPSPDEMLNIIFKEKINYKPDLVLTPNTGAKIINSNFQALVLGLYLADFSYTLLYNDFNQSAKYLEVIKALSDNIGVGGIYNERFFSRLEANINNIDSLKSVFNDFSENSFNTVGESGNNEILSLISMGVSIESIYLGYNVCKTESFEKSLKPFFIEQRMVFENFYQNYINYNGNKKDLEAFNTSLSSFYSLFKLNIWLMVDKNNISKTDSIISMDVKYIVKTNNENINELGKSICKLRETFINLSQQ